MRDPANPDPGPSSIPNPAADPGWDARLLLRGARAGMLATQEGGQPFASLVTPATAPDGSVLMLLSGLSPHTRHLRAEPRCSVLVQGPATDRNPQTAPRLTVVGRAVPEPEPALKARWVALHPYAAFYADLGDFQIWRLTAESGQFVAGFGRAYRLAGAALRPAPDAAMAVAAAEPHILAHVNADHADAVALIAKFHGGDPGSDPGGWAMVAADTDGCDLARGEAVLRVAWSRPVADANGVRAALVALTSAARSAGPAPAPPL